jgi:hypothetical protein
MTDQPPAQQQERAGREPTQAQASILAQLSTGAIVYPIGDRMDLVLSDGKMGGRVPRRTLESLRRHGWVASIQYPGLRPFYLINDRGRAALAALRAPVVEAGNE